MNTTEINKTVLELKTKKINQQKDKINSMSLVIVIKEVESLEEEEGEIPPHSHEEGCRDMVFMVGKHMRVTVEVL